MATAPKALQFMFNVSGNGKGLEEYH